MAESEVARLRRQIELECEAMNRGLNGFAITAKHKIIAHKYSQLGVYKQQLQQLVGENQAVTILAEIYIQVMNESSEQTSQSAQNSPLPLSVQPDTQA